MKMKVPLTENNTIVLESCFRLADIIFNMDFSMYILNSLSKTTDAICSILKLIAATWP